MKNGLFIFVALLALVSCKKYDVDIAALNTNPFDADHAGAPLIRLDSVRTVPVIAGAVYQQRIYIGTTPELRASNDHVLRLIDVSGGDTTSYPAGATPQATMVLLNQQVQLGTEYCFIIDLIVSGEVFNDHRIELCDTAQL